MSSREPEKERRANPKDICADDCEHFIDYTFCRGSRVKDTCPYKARKCLCPKVRNERIFMWNEGLREKFRKGELLCHICGKPFQEGETLIEFESSYCHWHCLRKRNGIG